jgi:glycosyltransferase involved in cell wall biosynthesis
MHQSIVLVSSVQPSANPRLVKEALALNAAGYTVAVVYCTLSPWADEFDATLFARNPGIRWVSAGHHPVHQKKKYQWARLRRKFYHVLFCIAGNRADAAVRSFAFYSQELTKAALAQKADLYIGHNIGALSSVVWAARKNNAKATFDFEDFHRGEENVDSLHWKKVKTIEDRYVPSLANATTASPLITEAYRKLYPAIRFQTINNCFPLAYGKQQLAELSAKPLKLFWFSQFVGPKRGLETVIEAMGKTGNPNIQLSLLGNCKGDLKKYFQDKAGEYALLPEQLCFLEPVTEKEIVSIAAQHHIGLAVEVPHILNREICLTNKLFMYLLAGNAVILSNTKAQARILATYPGIGNMYEQADVEQLTRLLKRYIGDPQLLHQQREESLRLGKEELNWEKESELFLQYVSLTLSAA